MNYQEWIGCSDPLQFLQFLREEFDDRKFRLYLCGGCRQISHLFYRPESLVAVEVAERFADNTATLDELDVADWNAESPTFGVEITGRFHFDSPTRRKVVPRLIEMGVLPQAALEPYDWVINDEVIMRLLSAAELAYHCVLRPNLNERDWPIDCISKVDWPGRWLIDCVFGNPFSRVHLDKAWLTDAVKKLARVAYEERLPDSCLNPILLTTLADELMMSGCRNASMLDHLRKQTQHVRGCWVLDSLLRETNAGS